MMECDYIVDHTLCDALARHSPSHRNFLAALPRFPDGSLLIQSADHATKFFAIFGIGVSATERVLQLTTALENDGVAAFSSSTVFRSIAPFGQRLYSLLHNGIYQKRLGDELAMVITPSWDLRQCPIRGEESRTASLPVTLHFKRILKRKEIDDLLAILKGWLSAAKISGILGEKPPNGILNPLVFDGNRLRFFIDLGAARQQSLNWLTLQFLNFSLTCVPVTVISYAGHEVYDYRVKSGAPIEIKADFE